MPFKEHVAQDLPVFRLAFGYAVEMSKLMDALPKAENTPGGIGLDVRYAAQEMMITIVRAYHDYMTDAERDTQLAKAVALTRELEVSFALLRDRGFWMPKLHDMWLSRYMEVNGMLNDLIGKPVPGLRGHLRVVS